jgi:cytochrome c peroxidase
MTPLFNLGHRSFTKLFWDGRVQADSTIPQGFATPAGENLPFGFDNALETLSIFAIADAQEMTGVPGTNDLANASLVSPHIAIWDALILRLKEIPEYLDLFTQAFPEINDDPSKMLIIHVGKAMAAFQATAFRSDNSPFDRYLHGDRKAMSKNAKRGMKKFYGKAGCSRCHSGIFQTDHDFHAIGIPQVGPGFGDGDNGHEDFGREGFTGNIQDRYRFRTPSLRNVVLTGPWGHDGFYNSLEAIVRHHLAPIHALNNANPSQIVMPPRPDLDALDLIAFDDPPTTAALIQAIEIEPVSLFDNEISDLIDFLHALTDPSALDLRKSIPNRVPSGLPLAEIRFDKSFNKKNTD